MHAPTLDEVLKGAFEEQKTNYYYTSVMRYPKKGGFRSILNTTREGLEIKFKKEVCEIDTNRKTIKFTDGTISKYERLISTLPLPEIVNIVINCPQNVKDAAKNLHYTCGYMVSLGFNRPNVAKHLWFYIYDEEISPSRVHSPSLKSPDNAPIDCSSIQAEVFFDCKSEIPPKEEVLKKTIQELINMGIFKEEDIVVKDIRFEKYANVTFDKDIYSNRKIVLDYLSKVGIESIGRFGKWDYLWTFQAFQSGMEVVKTTCNL